MTNIPAVCFGLWVMDKFGIRRYDWLGRNGKNSIWEWDILHCHKRWGGNSYVQILLLIHFLTGFFLINAFLIPPKHAYPIGRLILWFGFGAIAFREGYQDLETWNTPQRQFNPVEGRYRWLATGILFTEALVCWRYRFGTGHILDNPTPIYIWLPWTLFFVFLFVYWVYLRFGSRYTPKYPGEKGYFAVEKDDSKTVSESKKKNSSG